MRYISSYGVIRMVEGLGLDFYTNKTLSSSAQLQDRSPTGVPAAFALRVKGTELVADHIHLVPMVKLRENTR
jgi:hypothetical protein